MTSDEFSIACEYGHVLSVAVRDVSTSYGVGFELLVDAGRGDAPLETPSGGRRCFPSVDAARGFARAAGYVGRLCVD